MIDDKNSTQRQCFEYDQLDRLTRAFIGSTADCTTYGNIGTGVYDHTYAYDAIGNLTNYNGASSTYSSSQPHAVTAAHGNSYGYDANGNQTTRTISGMPHTMAFDYENRITAVKQGSTTIATFVYDAEGNRVKGMVNGVTTFYIAGNYEHENGASTTYYSGAGGAIAMRRTG
ncbi:MAG: hypothetical protein AAF639_15260 [Chloroflexota bacterium]